MTSGVSDWVLLQEVEQDMELKPVAVCPEDKLKPLVLFQVLNDVIEVNHTNFHQQSKLLLQNMVSNGYSVIYEDYIAFFMESLKLAN